MKKRGRSASLDWTLRNPHQAEIFYGKRQARWLEKMGRAPRKELVREPGLLPPGGKGYGGFDEWPFDWNHALSNTGYRTGIRNALDNVNFSVSWREAARNKLRRLLDYSIKVEMEVADIERAMYEDEMYQRGGYNISPDDPYYNHDIFEEDAIDPQ